MNWPLRCRRHRLALAVFLSGCLALTAGLGAASHATEALLLSCMDYRLTDDITRYMDGRGLHDAYDHVVLAGASLGAQTRKHRAWGKTFREHLEVSIQLHRIRKVVLLDHRDCGAYKVLLDEDFAATPAREVEVHARYLRALRKEILARHPRLEVEMLLMALDGSVESVPAS